MSEFVADSMTLTQVQQLVRGLTPAQVCRRVSHGFLLERRRPPASNVRHGFGTIAVSKEDLGIGVELEGDDRKVLVLPDRGAAPTPQWVTIGRAPNVAVHLDHASVSKLHAVLRLTAEGFCIADAGSKNGTWVNDEPVARYDRGTPRMLRSGDRVQVGSFSFIYLAPAEVEAFLSDP